jgi:hypothetical protein
MSRRFRNRDDYSDVPLKAHFRRANKVLASIWSMLTLEGASLFHADLVLKANQDKFNSEFHRQSNDLLPTCQLSPFEDANELPLNTEAIFLRQKSARPNNMPSSIAARMDAPKTFESYEGIEFGHEAFDLPFFDGPRERKFYPCRIVKRYVSEGDFDVLLFVQKNGKRMLIKRSHMPCDLLQFRIMPDHDRLKGLVELFREHIMKDFDGSGSISDSYRRTRTALLEIETFDDIQAVVQRNGTAMATTQPRSKEWLEENGTNGCA